MAVNPDHLKLAQHALRCVRRGVANLVTNLSHPGREGGGVKGPVVVRMDGTSVQEARRILEEARREIPTMTTATDLADAAKKVCAAVTVTA